MVLLASLVGRYYDRPVRLLLSRSHCSAPTLAAAGAGG